MSRLVVFTFDTVRDAGQARLALRELERRGSLVLDDALIVEREAAGRVRRRRDRSSAALIGAVVGGLMGVPLVFTFTPISILFGVGAGGAIGRLALASGPRVDEEFVDSAEGALRPGTSRAASPGAPRRRGRDRGCPARAPTACPRGRR